MLTKLDDKPIIACSSGVGKNVAISLIRLSGFKDFGSIEPLLKFSKKKKINFGSIEPKRSYLVEIIDKNELIDEVILTFYQAPHSYTGENLIELGVHGNKINVERIMGLFCQKAGFRQAYGGEFSYRALKNKKLNLSQVEGLDLLLNANNLFSLKQGFSLLKGELQVEFNQLQTYYLNHRSALELSIDFLEDMGEEQAYKELHKTFNLLKKNIKALYLRVSNDINLANPQIALFGPPNAGKSTFFNLLLGHDRSIVSKERGTTRDYISETLKVEDNYYELLDTAGIRKSTNEVEALGIKRSQDFMGKVFFKILLINPLDNNQEFLKTIEGEEFDILLLTHEDKTSFKERETEFLENISFSYKWFYRTTLMNENDNLETFKHNLFANINDKYLKLQENNPITLTRHIETIKEIHGQLEEYEKVLKTENDIAIIGSELYIFGQKVEELLGVISPDRVLGNIFSNFCIGK